MRILPLLVMGLLIGSGFLAWCVTQPGQEAPAVIDPPTTTKGTRASSFEEWLLNPPIVNNTGYATFWNATTAEDFNRGLMVNTQAASVGDGGMTLQPSEDYGVFPGQSPEILSMAYSRNGSILCGLASGKVFAFDPLNETKTEIFDTKVFYSGMGNVSAMAVDTYDHLWGVCRDNNRLFLLDLTNGNEYDLGTQSTVDSTISVLCADKRGHMWAGSANKGLLHCFDTITTAKLTFDHFPSNNLSIRTLAVDDRSDMLFVGTGASSDISAPNQMDAHLMMIDPTVNMSLTWPITDIGVQSGFKSITAMELDHNHNIIFGVVPGGKVCKLNLETNESYSGNNPVGANTITSMYYTEMSNSVICGTDKEGQIFSYNPGGNYYTTLSDGFAGCQSVNCLVTQSDLFGIWGSQFPTGHLFKMVVTGIWMSPVLNATEPAIWDTLHLEYSQATGGFVFGFMRFGNNVSEVTHSDFNDSTVFFQPSAIINIPECQYLQVALILQTPNAFDPAVAPILRSVNVTLGYHVAMEVAQTCDHKEAVAGSVVNYTVYVNNTSNGQADAKVRLDVPDNAQVQNASIPYELETGPVALFRLENITHGQHLQFNVSLKVTGAILPGADTLVTHFDLNCTAIRNRYGPEAASNVVSVPLKEAQAFVELSLDRGIASPGEQVGGTLTVDVTSGFDIANTNVTLTLPQNIEFINASVGWGIIEQDPGILAFWDLGSIARGGQKNVTLLLKLDAGAADDTVISLVARLNYTDGLGVNKYSDSAPVVDLEVRAPLLGLSLSTDPAGLTAANIGQSVPFKLTYSNPGHRSALNVVITVNFTDNAEYTANPSFREITWTMAEIPAQTPPMALDFALRVLHVAPNGSALNVSVSMHYQMFTGAPETTGALPQLSLPIKRPAFEATVDQKDKEPGLRALGTANLVLDWENIGNGDCKELAVKMVLDTPGLHLLGDKAKTQETRAIVDVLSGDSGSCSFDIAAEKDIAIGSVAKVKFELAFTDAAGNPYSKIISSFDLELKPRALPSEPFKLMGITPQDGAADVPITARFSARTNFAVDGSSLNASVTVTPEVEHDVQLRNGSTEILIKFPNGLEWGKSYSVMVSSSLKDEYGRNLDRTYYVNFTTEKVDNTDNGPSAVLCAFVLVLVVITLVVVVFLFVRQKRMRDRISELDEAKGSGAEEPEIVYEPETTVEELPKVSKARPAARAPKPAEPAAAAKPMPAQATVSLSAQPEAPAKMPQTPSAELPKDIKSQDDMDKDDPYKVDLDLMRSQQSSGAKPLLFLPPAVILDMEEAEETPYHIDEVLVMTKEGILVQHFTSRGSTEIDEDILAGMLTAVQMFVKDTFGGNKDGTLDELSMGDFKIMITRGEYLTISAILSGENTKEVRPQLDAMVKATETGMKDVLSTWNGDMDKVTGIREYIKDFVEGKYKEK